jgi:hypothetical protein
MRSSVPYDFFHDDPRYLALVQKIGRPPAN